MSGIVEARPIDMNLMCEKKHVEEVEEVVGEWRFFIERCPVILKIKVMKTTAVPGMYTGLANYMIQSPRQGGPYRSVYFKDTAKEALEDALRGFLAYYDPEKAEETRYVPVKDW